MDYRDCVHKLIKGSKALDRMMEEISLVVGTMIGLIQDTKSIHRFLKPGNTVHTGGKGTWRVNVFGDDEVVKISYYWSDTTSEPVYSKTSYMHKTSIKATYIEEVHQALHALVEEMLRTYPQLQMKAQPILDAAYTF